MMSYCIEENGAIANIVEASAEYAASQGWIPNQGWGIGWVRSGDAFVSPEAQAPEAPVPAEVPRWAGLLSIKRHALQSGELQFLPADDPGEDSLHVAVQSLRASMPAGEARDRLDVALNDAKDWMLRSPTVATICTALTLRDDQRDALFVWAHAQVGTV